MTALRKHQQRRHGGHQLERPLLEHSIVKDCWTWLDPGGVALSVIEVRALRCASAVALRVCWPRRGVRALTRGCSLRLIRGIEPAGERVLAR